jgi:hypothetical protein
MIAVVAIKSFRFFHQITVVKLVNSIWFLDLKSWITVRLSDRRVDITMKQFNLSLGFLHNNGVYWASWVGSLRGTRFRRCFGKYCICYL